MNYDDYGKAIFQFRGAVTDVLQVYNLYGLGVHNERGQVTDIIEKLALQLHARLHGIDVPIGKEYERVSIVSDAPDD